MGIALQLHPEDNEFMIYLTEEDLDPFAQDYYGNSAYSKMKRYESGEMTRGENKLDIEPVIEAIDKLHKNQ